MTTAASFLSSVQLPAADAERPAVGFKDWALICEAMGTGRQSLILRKGGLAEGRGGFGFHHETFFLFPTRYHEQALKIRPDELAAVDAAGGDEAGVVPIRYGCRLERSWRVEDWETVRRLEPFHVYREEVARERFAYADRHHTEGALSVAFCRVYRLDPAWTLPNSPAFGGCKSWIGLPPTAPAGTQWQPVLDEEAHRVRREALSRILGV